MEGGCDFLTALLGVRVHSNPSSKRRKRRKKNRSSCELHMWLWLEEYVAASYCENFKQSESVQADCGI